MTSPLDNDTSRHEKARYQTKWSMRIADVNKHSRYQRIREIIIIKINTHTHMLYTCKYIVHALFGFRKKDVNTRMFSFLINLNFIEKTLGRSRKF